LFPLKWVVWLVTFGSYRSIAKMKNILIPVLFIKGMRDELVPSRLMDQLENELHTRNREHFAFEV
jgi:predicted esterase